MALVPALPWRYRTTGLLSLRLFSNHCVQLGASFLGAEETKDSGKTCLKMYNERQFILKTIFMVTSDYESFLSYSLVTGPYSTKTFLFHGIIFNTILSTYHTPTLTFFSVSRKKVLVPGRPFFSGCSKLKKSGILTVKEPKTIIICNYQARLRI